MPLSGVVKYAVNEQQSAMKLIYHVHAICQENLRVNGMGLLQDKVIEIDRDTIFGLGGKEYYQVYVFHVHRA